MTIFRYFNDRVKKLTIFDIKLAQGAAMCIALIIAKLFPEVLSISVWWFVAAAIVLGIRPMYAFFVK